jgi:Divergent InlB B-repeat domain
MRVRRGVRSVLPLLIALVAALAFSPSASAAEYTLEVSEALDGTGFGEVACEYKVEGLLEVEQPCEELFFESKKAIKLVPMPEPGSEFVQFKNGTGSAAACNGMTKTCSFTLEADSYIEAKFDQITPSLVVKASGEGEVECAVEGGLPELCEAEYPFETEVTLVPEPFEGWEFASFKNGTGSASKCSGLTKPCALLLEKDSTLEATFVPAMHPLSVTKAGNGAGTVTCNGTTCAASYLEGTEVTLKATAASGSVFSGWSGEGCSGTGSCVVTIEEKAATVTATFTANSKPPGEEPKEPKDGTATAAAVAKVKGGKAKVKLSCSGGLCKGAVRLTAKLRRGAGPVLIGRAPFTLASGESTVLPVKLSAAAKHKLKKSHTLRTKAGGTGVTPAAIKLKLAR